MALYGDGLDLLDQDNKDIFGDFISQVLSHGVATG